MSDKPRRCKRPDCNRIIRPNNKSGYCCGCVNNYLRKKIFRGKCNICQEPCSGNLLIQWRKDAFISLCTYHFNKLNLIQDPKELRKKVKYLKSYH